MPDSTFPLSSLRERTFKLQSPLAGRSLPHSAFTVFESRPTDVSAIKGGVVIVQEIFGVNSHIRAVARHYAQLGYVAWAPAFFDHIETGIELSYGPEDFAIARPMVAKLGWDVPVEDARIAGEALKTTLPASRRKIALVGYCWGGSLAWLTATRLPRTYAAAVSYYGRQALDFQNETPGIPLILHFGKKDEHIPVDQASALAKTHPDVPVYFYEAGHGFNCDMRKDHDGVAANLAEQRTLDLIEKAFAAQANASTDATI